MARSGSSSVSLTERLSLLFAAVSLVVLAAIGIYLHHALVRQFVLRDDQELNGKIELIRHTLADVGSVTTIEASPKRWLDVVVGHHGLNLAIYAGDGRRLLATTALKFPAQAFVNPAPESVTRATVIEWEAGDGTHLRSVCAWGALGKSNGERVLIAIALDRAEERKLLAAYGVNILGAVLAGAILAAVLGLWVTRQGLAPLQSVAAAAGRITASRLGERLDAGAAPRELQSLAAAYNAMLDRLQDSFARLTQFSSDLAHDFRTPVGNLLGEAQVALSRSRDAAEYRAIIESSVEELERLSRMIESMLFLARADNAQLALNPEKVRLAAEFEKIRDYFEPLAQEKSIAIEASGEATVYADPSLLRRAISNLVVNAIRFTPVRGGPITLVGAYTADGGTEIRVGNPGPEIPTQDRDRVFDRFYRIGDARSESMANSGLGLAIVKSVLSLHAGSASVESAHGRTTFTLRFPPAEIARATAD